jgi:UDP-4-amino-4,6-dideoxy-N-acetyl-beta-L-altrosamine N-acetyltransferase
VTDWASLALTPIETRDLDAVNAWQNDPEIRDLIMGFRGPVRRETTAEWIRNLADQNLKTRVVFAIRVAGEIRGVVQLHGIDWVLRTAILGVFVGEARERGAGLGRAAVTLILDYAFNGLDLHRISLEVLASNARAQRLYENLGFVREGSLREAYQRAGAREDVVLYGLLKGEWALRPPAAAHRLTCPV